MNQYLFSDLILLVGTNPLPNLVVADYFLKHNSNLNKIWLIHSGKRVDINQEGTDEQAARLQKILKNNRVPDRNIFFEYIPLSDVGNAREIETDIKDKLIKPLGKNAVIHLNYTGGTKVMGTHVYRTIEKEYQQSRSCSYLDGRRFKIIDDDEGIISNDLRDEITFSFQELIELHGFKRKNEDKESIFQNVILTFKTLIDNDKLNGFYDENYGFNRKLFRDKNNENWAKKLKSLEQKKDEIQEFQPNDIFISIISSMPEGYRFFDEKNKFVWPSCNKECEEKLIEAVKFLDGDWLELYVYEEIQKALPGIQVEKNWVIKKEEWSTEFEIDIPLIKGYQLIGISCTTDDKKALCKSKGFEIGLRTKQIGGDEAKSILICRLNSAKVKEVQDELELDTGGGLNILVLGIEDLKADRMIKKIRDFIK